MANHPADSSSSSHGEAHASLDGPSLEGDDLPHHGAALAEPRSPAWLPLLGIALLAVVLVWWLSTPSDAEERAAAAAASASAAAASASAAPSATAAIASAQQLQPAPPRPVPNPPTPNAPTPNAPTPNVVPVPNAPPAGHPTYVKPADGKAH